MKGIFITGTDTGVGKTVVSAVIIRALIKRGIRVGAMKPFETGGGADGMFLREMAGMDDDIDLITPFRFEQPLAPMVAADMEHEAVGPETVLKAYGTLSGKYDLMVVEGVGGLMVPLSRLAAPDFRSGAYYVTDLIRDLRLPVVIVTRPALGTINHTLLSVEHAMREGLEILGVIISYSSYPVDAVAERTNPGVLKELCPAPVIGTVPFMDAISREKIDEIAANEGAAISDRLFQ